MVYILMKRYQVYLNPESVEVLDGVEKETRISRSKIIREAVERLAENINATLAERKRKSKKFLLDDLAGFIDLKTDKETNFAQSVDDIYLID